MKLVGVTSFFLASFSQADTTYRGSVTTTVGGKTCQKWTEKSPHDHSYTPDNYPDFGLGDHNYCRNPSESSGGIWCYTTDPDTRWEYCNAEEEVEEEEKQTRLALNSDCVDDNLVITIPVDNEQMSNVLRLSAGNCTESNIPRGLENAVSYDSDNKAVVISIPIDACDMKKDLYNTPVIRAANALYRPTANVTLGHTFNDLEMVFQNLHIAAECGMKTIYEVDFVYNVEHGAEDEGCTMVDDVCVFPGAKDDVRFEFTEFISDDYKTPVNDTTRASKPGSKIHMQLKADEIPDNYDFAVTMCKIIDSNLREHEIINPAEGNCQLEEIDFQSSYTDNAFQMSHILFLIDDPKKVSYTLRCTVELCDKDNADSRCKKSVKSCAGGLECDASTYEPLADDVVIAQHRSDFDGLTQISSQFARSAVGAAYLNKFKAVHNTYGYRVHKTNNCCACTSDDTSISPEGASKWMNPSQPDLTSNNCNAATINYRPTLCGYFTSCNIDWSTVTLATSGCQDNCARETTSSYIMSGIFMNSEIYRALEDKCSFAVIRAASVDDSFAGDAGSV